MRNKIIIYLFILFLCAPSVLADALKSPFNHLILNTKERAGQYSFIVAGHLYGSPANERSVFPASSLLANIDMINSKDAKFFVSLGDIFRQPDNFQMSNFQKVAKKLNMPLFNSVGNHDVSSRKLYEEKFGKTYYHFVYGNELFVFLDTEIDSGKAYFEQLDYFAGVFHKAIKNSDIKNVFVFSHKLIWSLDNPDFKVVFDNLNNPADYSRGYKFKRKIEPAIIDLSKYKSVYWISGDIGCPWSLPLFYSKDPSHNIVYLATGIADTEKDAILQITVKNSGGVEFTPISLSRRELYPIKQYGLAYWKNSFKAEGGTGTESLMRKTVRVLRHRYFWTGAFMSGLLGTIVILHQGKSKRG